MNPRQSFHVVTVYRFDAVLYKCSYNKYNQPDVPLQQALTSWLGVQSAARQLAVAVNVWECENVQQEVIKN